MAWSSYFPCRPCHDHAIFHDDHYMISPWSYHGEYESPWSCHVIAWSSCLSMAVNPGSSKVWSDKKYWGSVEKCYSRTVGKISSNSTIIYHYGAKLVKVYAERKKGHIAGGTYHAGEVPKAPGSIVISILVQLNYFWTSFKVFYIYIYLFIYIVIYIDWIL